MFICMMVPGEVIDEVTWIYPGIDSVSVDNIPASLPLSVSISDRLVCSLVAHEREYIIFTYIRSASSGSHHMVVLALYPQLATQWNDGSKVQADPY
jgi:hypothetical protein